MSNPDPIWVLTYEYEPHIIGGLGIAATKLTQAYTRTGVPNIVLSRSRSSRVQYAISGRHRIVRFPKSSAYYSRKLRQFKPQAIERWLQSRGWSKPGGIHIHSLQFAKLAAYLKKKYRIPLIYTCHSLIISEPGPNKGKKKAMARIQSTLLRTANLVAVPSRSELAHVNRAYPFCKGKTVVVNHGIDRPRGISRGPRSRLLYVGRLVPQKGITPLLKAAALLKRQGRNVNLDIAGKGSRGYVRQLKMVAARQGIASNVHWLGRCSPREIQRLYATRGAVIMPSERESFGLVALEALASGIPLVSTRSGGLSEFVSSRVAQIIPRVDSTSIARAIRLMWKNRSLTVQRVAAGRRLALKYSWPRVVVRYRKLFQQTARKARRLKGAIPSGGM